MTQRGWGNGGPGQRSQSVEQFCGGKTGLKLFVLGIPDREKEEKEGKGQGLARTRKFKEGRKERRRLT